MGLACSQARLLTLTTRKSDCEYGISIGSINKMALTREMSELSQEYYSRLQAKQISYYANGQYNKINYNYLMGYGQQYDCVWDGTPIKEKNDMILTDYNGRVVLSKAYANAIISVLGADCMAGNGRGSTFSLSKIPEIIEKIFATGHGNGNLVSYRAEDYKKIIDGKDFDPANYDYNTVNKNTMTGEVTGSGTGNNVDAVQAKCEAIVNFYYPIFAAAATNGWTTEYNEEIEKNDNYMSDALVSGTFQLATVDKHGNYHENDSLTYFVTAGYVQARTDSDVREEITAWYNSEKEKITEKETYLDLRMDELSTELEAINTEIQSIQSLIDDAISSVFDWGNG